MAVKRTERGWAGHFICSYRCRFRRNTLLEYSEIRIVVSTVGLMAPLDSLKPLRSDCQWEQIGINRYFETMVFHAQHDGRYWDADVSREVSFKSPWSIDIADADDLANDMHEAVVAELTSRLDGGETFSVDEDDDE